MAFRSSPEPVLDTVRRAVKQTLFNVGYYHRRLSQLAFPGVAILCYHGIRGAGEPAPPFNDLHVDEETFSRHSRTSAIPYRSTIFEHRARGGDHCLPGP